MPPKKAAGDAASSKAGAAAGKNDPEEVLLDVCGNPSSQSCFSLINVMDSRLMLTVFTFLASSVDTVAPPAFDSFIYFA